MCERGAVMTLKELRKNCKLTQKEASEVVGMPLRTYVNYETDETKADQIKLDGIKDRLMEYAAKDTSILKDKVYLSLVEQEALVTLLLIVSFQQILKKLEFSLVMRRNKMICVKRITTPNLSSILEM